MRNVALLGTRLVLGSYLGVHGAQKLFGTFGGSGLDKAGAGFDRIGLRPGRTMAIAAVGRGGRGGRCPAGGRPGDQDAHRGTPDPGQPH
jgi:putative oxidoreductase